MRQTFVAELVGDADLPNAVALNSTSFNAARMVGPAVAGVVITSIGTGWAFLINGVSFVAVLISLTLLRVTELHTNARADRAKGSSTHGIVADEVGCGGVIRPQEVQEQKSKCGVGEAENSSVRILTMLPRSAELYRKQIEEGLGGDLIGAAKARTILRDLLVEIMLSLGEDGSLWAEYGTQPAALLQGAGTSGRGDRI